MDKRSILGFVLITVVISVWMIYNSFNTQHELPKPKKKTEAVKAVDSSSAEINNKKDSTKAINPAEQVNADSLKKHSEYGSFAPFVNAGEELITIETDLYTAVMSSKGGALKKWTLKNYKKWDKVPTQLIWEKAGQLGIKINSRESQADTIDTRYLTFKMDNKGQTYYKLKSTDSLTLTAVLQLNDNSAIIRKITFFNGKYHLTADITMQNMENYLRSKKYEFQWKNGLAYQEINSVDESNSALAMIVNNGEISELNCTDNSEAPISPIGDLDFAAVKTKYFTAAIIPQPFRSNKVSAAASGNVQSVDNKGTIERYNLSLKVPYEGGVQTNSFQIYIGPLDYDLCSDYGLEALINFGWRLIVRPIGEFFMLPFFKMIHSFVPNYGISILIFSLIMKFLLYPFTITQMRSTQKMKLVAPELQALKEKYKDDPKAQQQATMQIYSQYGVNPAGGCLPLLLQMPILYSLWAVMSNVIDLRQADFILWIHDLSLPDYIITFPTSILGISHLSGLSLLMGITMFVQQKMTVTDPKQKAMVYMMPIMFTLMFSYFPAGLNLYYFTFNVLGIAQQYWINNFSKKKLTLEDLKKAPKKEGWFQRKMREAQEMAQAQGKIPPGANKHGQNNNNINPKNRLNNKNNQKKK